MTQPELTSEEEKILHQLCGYTFQPVNPESSEQPEEKSADDMMLDEVAKNIR